MNHHIIVNRNTVTFWYILKTVGENIPVSPSKGNIAHFLLVKACVKEKVLDKILFYRLLNYVMADKGCTGMADSLEMYFGNWIDNHIMINFHESNNGYGFLVRC